MKSRVRSIAVAALWAVGAIPLAASATTNLFAAREQMAATVSEWVRESFVGAPRD